MDYVPAYQSQISHLQNPNFVIIWTKKWRVELQKWKDDSNNIRYVLHMVQFRRQYYWLSSCLYGS